MSVASVPRLLGQPAQFRLKKSLMILFLLSVAYSSVLRGFLGGVIVLNVTFLKEEKRSIDELLKAVKCFIVVRRRSSVFSLSIGKIL